MKGRSTKELEQLKSLSLKIWEVRSKSVAITEKNKNMPGQSYNQPVAFVYNS